MVLDAIAEYTGVDKGAVLAPLSVLASTFVGASIALYTVFSHRKIARLKNSMDFINSYNKDQGVSIAIKEIIALKGQAATFIERMATKEGYCINTEHIRIVLNYYESMAICINHKVYDETIIKETVCTTVLNIWNICHPYVEERRKQNDNKKTYYQELSKLSKKWKDKSLKEK